MSKILITRRGAVKLGSAAFITSICGKAAFANTTFEQAKARGVLTVGIANERPYGYVETDGRLVGAIPDILRALLQPHGIHELNAQIVDFNALIPGLNANRFDIIGAGMYINPTRCGAIGFSNPVTQAGGGLLVREDDNIIFKDDVIIAVKNLADLATNTELVVGTQSGSAQVAELTEAGLPRDRMVLFTRVDEAVAGILAERCDAIYFPGLQINEILKLYANTSLVRVENFETPLNYAGFGLRKADTDLKQAIDEGLSQMIADGRLLEIVRDYGYSEKEIPQSDITAEQICSVD